jgi:hypothetical protein
MATRGVHALRACNAPVASPPQRESAGRDFRVTIRAGRVGTPLEKLSVETRRRDGAGQPKEPVMNKKQIALAVVLADFAALNVYAISQFGLAGIFEAAFANAATVLVFVDLTIALTMVMAWMWRDAHQHDMNPLPYVVTTLALGSVGPLLYLIRRFGRDEAVAPQSALAPRAHAVRA